MSVVCSLVKYIIVVYRFLKYIIVFHRFLGYMIVVCRFLDMHMYVTSALQRTDMKAVGLQLALDLLHEKVTT
jgi:hypothetical protein